MRLKPGNLAPLFATTDVYGRSVAITQYAGRHLLLSFYRAAVCPLCTLRLAHLIDRAPAYARQGLSLLAIFESSPSATLKYMSGLQVPFPVIGDVEGRLYARYGLEASLPHAAWGWLWRRGAFREAARRRLGGSWWQNLTQTRGPMGRLPGDFLIGPTLHIERAYYGRDAGDFMLFADIDALVAGFTTSSRFASR
jgi:thioredoxin-dependent peroxiredoxin